MLADLAWHDGTPVVGLAAADPAAAAGRGWRERGWIALAGTELEFIVFRDTYEQARDRGLPRT